MKKLIILLSIILIANIIYAQKSLVNKASSLIESGDLMEAYENIQEAINPDNEKADVTLPWDKTWEVRGDLMRAIYTSEDQNIKSLVEDPLTIALQSYQKALELDEKGRNANGIKLKLIGLASNFSNQAMETYESEDFEMAFQSFEQILEVENMPIIKNDDPDLVDSVIIFNAALAAYNGGLYEEAIDYFKESAAIGYYPTDSYLRISDSYKMMGDTTGAVDFITNVFESNPEDNAVLVEMINLYISTKKTDEALRYLDVALEDDSENSSYWFAKGALHDQLQDFEIAIECYETALELSPDDFNTNYNLGVIYYNQGVQQLQVANDVPPREVEKFEEEKAKADEWFNQSFPYMIKCHELDPQDVFTIESLKNLYYRQGNTEKYNEMDSLLQNL